MHMNHIFQLTWFGYFGYFYSFWAGKKQLKEVILPIPCLQSPIPPTSLCWSEHLVHVQIKTDFIWHYLLMYFLLSWQCWQTMGQGYSFIWHCELLLDDITPLNYLTSPSLNVFVRKYSWASERCREYTNDNHFVISTQLKSCDPDEQTFHFLCRSCFWSCLKIQSLFFSCSWKQTYLSLNEDFLHFQGFI